eukprot:SAG22_NODE_1801_length_3538_cov_4.250581_2_plen_79_part_00
MMSLEIIWFHPWSCHPTNRDATLAGDASGWSESAPGRGQDGTREPAGTHLDRIRIRTLPELINGRNPMQDLYSCTLVI